MIKFCFIMTSMLTTESLDLSSSEVLASPEYFSDVSELSIPTSILLNSPMQPPTTEQPPRKIQKTYKKQKREDVPQDVPVNCLWDNCDEILPNLSELGKHLHSHIIMQKKENRTNRKSGYQCKWSGCERDTPFKGTYNLEHHLRYQHTGEKPHICKWCSTGFAQKSDLTEHLSNIHNRKEPELKTSNFHSYANGYPHPFAEENTSSPMVRIPGFSKPLVPILPAPEPMYQNSYERIGIKPNCGTPFEPQQLVVPFHNNNPIRNSVMGLDFPMVNSFLHLTKPAHPSFSFSQEDLMPNVNSFDGTTGITGLSESGFWGHFLGSSNNGDQSPEE